MGGFVHLLRARAAETPRALFATFNGAPLTFATLDRRSDAIAAWLRGRGVRRGDTVAVMLRNSVDAVCLVFALAKAGVGWVPVNVQLVGDGLRYILEHAVPALLVAEPDLLDVVRPATGAPVVTPDALPSDGPGFDGTAPAADDLLAVSYTSGTTGRPKGVLVTHRMLWLAGEAVLLVGGMRDGDVPFQWEPLYHIGGAQMLMVPLLRRVHLAMVDRFSASAFWGQVKAAGATHIHYLGGILQILLRQPPGPLDRAHGARVAWGGGAPAEVWAPFRERFGLPIRECYGMTEASSITTCNDEGIPGAVGRPVPWFSVELRGADGRLAGPSERGEIVVRTSIPGAIFAGYRNNPEATARALREGALWTGDLGSWGPEGALRFHGRMSDSFRVRGQNVSAMEVESVVASHPDVADCAAIGVAAEIGEQDIKLFVQVKGGAKLDPAALDEWLEGRLAAYAHPRFIALVEGFERTPSQRIMKHRLDAGAEGCWRRDSGSAR